MWLPSWEGQPQPCEPACCLPLICSWIMRTAPAKRGLVGHVFILHLSPVSPQLNWQQPSPAVESWLEGTKSSQFSVPFLPRGRREHAARRVWPRREGWSLLGMEVFSWEWDTYLHTTYPSLWVGVPCVQQKGLTTQTNSILKVSHIFP